MEGNHEGSCGRCKCIEVQIKNLKSINSFKGALSKSYVYEKLDKSLNTNPDSTYDILATVLADAKVKHIQNIMKKFNKRKHFHQK